MRCATGRFARAVPTYSSRSSSLRRAVPALMVVFDFTTSGPFVKYSTFRPCSPVPRPETSPHPPLQPGPPERGLDGRCPPSALPDGGPGPGPLATQPVRGPPPRRWRHYRFLAALPERAEWEFLPSPGSAGRPGRRFWPPGECRSGRKRAHPPFPPYPAGGKGHQPEGLIHLTAAKISIIRMLTRGRYAPDGDGDPAYPVDRFPTFFPDFVLLPSLPPPTSAFGPLFYHVKAWISPDYWSFA